LNTFLGLCRGLGGLSAGSLLDVGFGVGAFFGSSWRELFFLTVSFGALGIGDRQKKESDKLIKRV